jgi:hypothetical protein
MLTTTATELPRLMQCIGSINMPAALPPDHDHEARDEGNAAHWLAKEIFDGRVYAPCAVGNKAYNGYVITEEMVENVQTYLSALDCGTMETETTFNGVGWEVRGRADHISWQCHPNDQYETPHVLTVDDFKYGWRLVSPEENYTLIAHAIGWCIRNQAAPREIVLRIHQPRPYHPDGPCREWRLSYVDLMSYYSRIAARLSEATDTLATGPMCAKCHALATCSKAREASMNAIDASGVAFSDTLPDHVLAYEYETLEQAAAVIKARYEALEELMTHRIKSGNVINGYALKQRLAQTRWKPGLTGEALSAATGVDLRKDGIVTPAEAKRRGVSKETVEALTDRPVIGAKLERIDADREARRWFGDR